MHFPCTLINSSGYEYKHSVGFISPFTSIRSMINFTIMCIFCQLYFHGVPVVPIAYITFLFFSSLQLLLCYSGCVMQRTSQYPWILSRNPHFIFLLMQISVGASIVFNPQTQTITRQLNNYYHLSVRSLRFIRWFRQSPYQRVFKFSVVDILKHT